MRTPGLTLLLFSLAAACGGGGDDDDTPAADAGAPDAGGQFVGAPEGAWTWIPIEGSQCLNGSPTGIGVNLNRASSKLAIVFEGGGACFNTASCATVAHASGFAAPELADFAAGPGAAGMFDRTDAANPLRDWNWVFVPYCTGDIHAGNNPSSIGNRRAVGYVNSTNATVRVRAEFAGAVEQVLVAGQSAGGFGAAYNYDQIARAFEGTRVDLLDDSGPPLSATYQTPCFEAMVRDAWGLDTTMPAGCTACATEGIGSLVEYYSAAYPEARQGYISSLGDLVIRQFLGFGYPSCEDPQIPMAADVFAAGIAELRDEIIEPLDNAAMFTIDSTTHVWTIDQPLAEIVVAEDDLATWLTELVDHTPGWDNVVPPAP